MKIEELPERLRWQPPTTGMEKQIARLVEMLRYGEHRRSEFAETIEATMAYAYSLEKQLRHIYKEKYELEECLAVSTPPFTAKWSIDQAISREGYIFDWYIEPLHWRCYLNESQTRADEKLWKRIRSSTYKQLLKKVRKQFEKTFPTYAPKYAPKYVPKSK